MYPVIHLPGKELSTYALCAVVGGLLAGAYVCLSAKKKGEDVDDTIIMMLLTALGVLFGSHMLYGIVTFPTVVQLFQKGLTIRSFQDVLDLAMFLFGGGVFYGGLGGGALVAWLYTRKKTKIRRFMPTYWLQPFRFSTFSDGLAAFWAAAAMAWKRRSVLFIRKIQSKPLTVWYASPYNWWNRPLTCYYFLCCIFCFRAACSKVG